MEEGSTGVFRCSGCGTTAKEAALAGGLAEMKSSEIIQPIEEADVSSGIHPEVFEALDASQWEEAHRIASHVATEWPEPTDREDAGSEPRLDPDPADPRVAHPNTRETK